MTTNTTIAPELLDQLLANSPAKPPALPERIEAVLQLREWVTKSCDPLGGTARPQGDRKVTGSYPPKPRDMGVQVPEGRLMPVLDLVYAECKPRNFWVTKFWARWASSGPSGGKRR